MSESDPLERPATDEEIAEVERLLKATSKKTEIVPLPKPARAEDCDRGVGAAGQRDAKVEPDILLS